jgi:hypothetical protein
MLLDLKIMDSGLTLKSIPLDHLQALMYVLQEARLVYLLITLLIQLEGTVLEFSMK